MIFKKNVFLKIGMNQLESTKIKIIVMRIQKKEY